MIYILWTKNPNHLLIVQNEIFNVFSSAPNLLENKQMVICSKQTAHQLNNDIRNLEMVYKKRGGRIITHSLCFITSSYHLQPKQMCPKDYIFRIIQEDICDYNPLCFMYSGFILDDIIMNLFTDNIEKTTDSVQKHLFSKIQDD